ncbi:EAL domain-containing protein [Ruminococcus flavefaciens]|uniref:EAL domain-containing protein n=1 Tax=Ruminococcus flavefaciens TaxID=1265 RepID=UPI0026F07654|nr:EAL domain-containing protein [Ruminococcus flavefaciens]
MQHIDEQYIVNNFESALDQGYVKAYYQPVIRTLTERICSVEALARWQDPVVGLLSPFLFINVLEKYHLIHKLDLAILDNICVTYNEMKKRGLPLHPFSINLSRLDFDEIDMLDAISKTLAKYDVPSTAIHIEITESVMLDNTAYFRRIFDSFHDAGFAIFMDDFGSGYSSLNVLKEYSFDVLKIDMRFLSDIGIRSKKILASVMNMAKAIGMHTLAEGVETKEQMTFLRNIGCEMLQGFYYSKPMDGDLYIKYISESKLEVEDPAENHYWNAVGQINFLSPDPLNDLTNEQIESGDYGFIRENSTALALIEQRGEQVELLYKNEAYEKGLQRIGFNSVDDMIKLINDNGSSNYSNVDSQVKMTIKTGDIIKEDHLVNGIYFTYCTKCIAEANGSKVTISHSGNYTIDGTLNDGQIYVEVPDDKADPDTVKLVFNGVNITGKNAPAVLIKNADKTSITLADGTENTVSDGTSPYGGDDQTNAVIEAKDDLTIKGGDAGTGVLNITANVQPAIVCNNDIKFTGGITNIDTLNLTEANDAVKGKSSVLVKGGQLNINSEGDGIKSSKGNVDIEGGEINIKCGNDAIQAETALNISGGKIAAFGDRGLTSAGTIGITGGDLLATATDNQCENLTSTEQNTIMIDFAKEWSKNNPIALTDSSNKVLFDQNTAKKYKYAIVSSPEIGSGEYKLFAGGIKQKHSSGSTFTGGKPAAYKDVNNDMENEEQLYGSFFDLGKVHKIDVKMSESDWNAFMNVAQKEEWYPCDLVIDGEEFKNVGIRTKGNSSRMMVNNGKYSFRFKLDKYEKLNNYHGLTEFCMNNFY